MKQTSQVQYLKSNGKDVFQIHVLFFTGAVYENKKNTGISHFLEHLLFMNGKSTSDITLRLSKIGAISNAYTSYDITCYYIRGTFEHYKEIINIMSDMFSSINFTEEAIKKEINVVLEELYKFSDRESIYYNALKKCLFHKDNPYAKSIIGKKDVLKKLKLQDIQDYFNKRYKKNSIIVCCPALQHHTVNLYMKQKFNIIDRINFEDLGLMIKATKYNPEIFIFYASKAQNTTILKFIGFPSIYVKETILIYFLSHILTDTNVGLLFHNMRILRGLVYEVSSTYNCTKYYNNFMISFSSSSKDIIYILKIIFDILNKLKEHGLSPKEFEHFKNSYYSFMKTVMQNDWYRTSLMGIYTLYANRRVEEEEVMHIIKNATNEEIKAIAESLFDYNHMGMVAVGKYNSPSGIKKKIKKLIVEYSDVEDN